MADHEFELRVQRLFGEAGGLFEPGESRAFAARVEARLARDWTLRRLAIGAAGTAGGALAVAQLASAHLFAHLDAASRASTAVAERGTGAAVDRLSLLAPLLRSLPLGAESLWLVAGMGVLAAALFASRLVDEV